MDDASPASRLFLALWPPPPVRQALQQHAEAWHWPAAARRTAPGRLHVTLHFLGLVAPQRMELLRALDLAWEGCKLELDTGQVWPGGIAVLEAGTVPTALAALHARSAAALRALGFALETRPWRPHVTLARSAQGARPAAGAVAWEMEPRCLLVRSLPGGRGYEAVRAFH